MHTAEELLTNRRAYVQQGADAAGLPMTAWVELPPEGKIACLELARQRKAIDSSPKAASLALPASSDAGVAGKRASKRRWAARARQEQPETTRAAQKRYRDTHRAEIAEAQRLYRAAQTAVPNPT
jgi:hypothetical protein